MGVSYRFSSQHQLAGIAGRAQPVTYHVRGAPKFTPLYRAASARGRVSRQPHLRHNYLFAVVSFVFLLVSAGFFLSHREIRSHSISGRLSSILSGTSTSNDALVMSRQAFLAQMNAHHRREIAGMVHFVGDVIRSTNRNVTEPEELARLIVVESRMAGVDPLYVAAVIKAESTFKNHARSHQGARGLMQLMPETARYISEKASLDWQGAALLADPAYNVRLGIAYLKYLDRHFQGDRERILIAYNWGPGNLTDALKSRRPLLASAQRYARSILATHSKWSEEYQTKLAHYHALAAGQA